MTDGNPKKTDGTWWIIGSPPDTWLWTFAVGLFGYVVAASYAPYLLVDPDTLTHIAVGRWIIEHHAIPFHDPFSYTFQGELWVPHEWLSEVILAAIYQWFSWGGICAITALSMSAALMLLTHWLMNWLKSPRPAIAAVFAFALSEYHFLARPHILALPLMVLWISRLVSAREAKRAPSFVILPVMVLWCNLHGGFVVGLFFCIVLAVEAIWEAKGSLRWTVGQQWGAFTLAAFVSALLSPNGINGMFAAIRMMQMTTALAITGEWQSPDFHQFQPLELWLAFVILGGFLLGIRLPISRILMVLLLLHQALFSRRNSELLGFIAPILVAAPLAKQLQDPIADRPVRSSAAAITLAATLRQALGLLTAAAVLFGATTIALNWRGIRPLENVAPRSALEAARAAGVAAGRVFNAYNFGGYLMFARVPMFIDGRADPYSDDFISSIFAAEKQGGKKLTDLLDRYSVSWTMLPTSNGAVGTLDQLPNWQRIYGDEFAVVHRRVR